MSSRFLAAVSALATISSSLPMFLLGVHAPQIMQKVGIGVESLGVAAGSFSLGLGLAGLLAARVVDRQAPSLSLHLGVGLTLGGLVIVVTSGNMAGLAGGLLVAGAGNALSQAASSRLLSSSAPQQKQGVLFGAFQSAKPAAALLAGLLGGLSQFLGDWRYSFLAAALLCLVVAGLATRLPATPVGGARGQGSQPHLNKQVLLFCVLLGLGFGITNSTTAFLVDYGVSVGYSAVTASWLLALGGLLAVSARMTVGWLMDTYAFSPARVMGSLFLGGALGLVTMAVGTKLTLLLGVALLFGLGWAFAGVLFAATSQLSPSNAGQSSGQILVGGAIGGTITPMVIGVIISSSGYSVAWLAVAAVALSAAALSLRAGRLPA